MSLSSVSGDRWEEALAKYGKPEIFNSDQGSQFTSPRFTGVLKEAGVKISNASMQNSVSIVFDNLHDSTLRLAQSMMATR